MISFNIELKNFFHHDIVINEYVKYGYNIKLLLSYSLLRTDILNSHDISVNILLDFSGLHWGSVPTQFRHSKNLPSQSF